MEMFMQISTEALIVAVKIAGPILGSALIAGLLISLFQATTQIQEMTLTFIPKIVASALTVAFFYDFMMRAIVDFTVRVMSLIPTVGH